MSNLDLARATACIAAFVGALTAAPANAIITAISITGDSAHSVSNSGSTFQAELTYSVTGDTSAALTIDLHNTTPTAGGFLTAFVLNNPGDKITSVSFTSPLTNWSGLGLASNGVNGSPFGQFDFGATTAPNPNNNAGFEGGGSPDRGIPSGAGGMFTFNLTGTGLTTLTAGSFLSALSFPPADAGTQFFAARFRGPGSDKVPAIPEVPAYAALLAGTALLTLRLRKRLPPG